MRSTESHTNHAKFTFLCGAFYSSSSFCMCVWWICVCLTFQWACRFWRVANASTNCECVKFNYPCQFSAVALRSCSTDRSQLPPTAVHLQSGIMGDNRSIDVGSISHVSAVYVSVCTRMHVDWADLNRKWKKEWKEKRSSESAHNHIRSKANSQQITIADRHIHALRTNYFRFRSIASQCFCFRLLCSLRSFWLVSLCVECDRWTSAPDSLFRNVNTHHQPIQWAFKRTVHLEFIAPKHTLSSEFCIRFVVFFSLCTSTLHVHLPSPIMISCCSDNNFLCRTQIY